MIETRHQFLKRTIHGRILKMTPGAKLSTELELCAEFNVSRMTVNKVVCELEREGLVTRIRHHGTFVRKRQRQAKLVTFLLPCPGNMVGNDYSSIYRRKLLSGAMRAIRETGSRLETIAVSPTNSAENIDFDTLDHLNRDSRVIVSGMWYAPIFEILYRRSAKVCLLDGQILYSCLSVHKFAKHWLIGDMDVKKGVYELTLKLHHKGCRRIAIMSPYLNYEGHPRLEGYRQALRETELDEFIFVRKMESVGALLTKEVRFLRQHQCDGLIVGASNFFGHNGEDINEILNLPEKIQIAAIYFDHEVNFLHRQPLSFDFDHEEMGYDSVMRLLSAEPEPRYQLYPPMLTNEE